MSGLPQGARPVAPADREPWSVRTVRVALFAAVGWTSLSLWAAWEAFVWDYQLRLPWRGYTLLYAYELVRGTYLPVLTAAVLLLLAALTAPDVRRRRGIYLALLLGLPTLIVHFPDVVRE